MLPYLLRVRDEARVPMLYVTHQLGEARVLAQEALLLERGRVKAVGPADAVLGGATRGVLGLEGEENILEGTLERPAEGGLRLRVTEGLSLWVPDAPELAAGHARGLCGARRGHPAVHGSAHRCLRAQRARGHGEADGGGGRGGRILLVEVEGVPLAAAGDGGAVRELGVARRARGCSSR